MTGPKPARQASAAPYAMRNMIWLAEVSEDGKVKKQDPAACLGGGSRRVERSSMPITEVREYG